jgi:enamine deaminase RidA (YjgF/YER057c/UK114 family)
MVVSTEGREQLLIAGTASIRGEETVFAGSLDAQVQETVRNLAAVVAAARGDAGGEPAAALARIDTARAYSTGHGSHKELESRLRAALPGVQTVEMIRATVCRTDLLVEIEATAGLHESPCEPRAYGGENQR